MPFAMMHSLNSTAGFPAVRSVKYEFKNWVLKYQNIVSVCVTGGALLKEKPARSSFSLHLFRFLASRHQFFIVL